MFLLPADLLTDYYFPTQPPNYSNYYLLVLTITSHVTPKEGTHISYLNIHLIQSPNGINIVNTSHIQDTILEKWLHCTSVCVNSPPTPLKVYSAFEIELYDTLPVRPTDIHNIKDH